MKKIITIWVFYQFIFGVITSQDLVQLSNLYSCQPKQMIKYDKEIILVTSSSIYLLKENRWCNISNNLDVSSVKKVCVVKSIIVALTSKGFFYSDLSNSNRATWVPLLNDAVLELEGKKLFAQGISDLFAIEKTFYLIGNHALYKFNSIDKKVQKICDIPYALNRNSYVVNDTIFILSNYNSESFYFLAKTNTFRKTTFDSVPNYVSEFDDSYVTDSITYKFDNSKCYKYINGILLNANYLPISLGFTKGIIKYSDGVLIASRDNGVFYYDISLEKLMPFNIGINEGWFIDMFARDSILVIDNPDDLSLYSQDLGVTWSMISKRSGYYSYKFETFNKQLISSRDNQLYYPCNDSIIVKFDSKIVCLLNYKESIIVVLENQKIICSKNLIRWNELSDLSDKGYGIHDIFQYHDSIYCKSVKMGFMKLNNFFGYNEHYNNIDLISAVLVPETINIIERDSITIEQRSDYWPLDFFNNYIFLRAGNRVLYSSNGKDFNSLCNSSDILSLAYNHNYVYLSLKEKGVFKIKLE